MLGAHKCERVPRRLLLRRRLRRRRRLRLLSLRLGLRLSLNLGCCRLSCCLLGLRLSRCRLLSPVRATTSRCGRTAS